METAWISYFPIIFFSFLVLLCILICKCKIFFIQQFYFLFNNPLWYQHSSWLLRKKRLFFVLLFFSIRMIFILVLIQAIFTQYYIHLYFISFRQHEPSSRRKIYIFLVLSTIIFFLFRCHIIGLKSKKRLKEKKNILKCQKYWFEYVWFIEMDLFYFITFFGPEIGPYYVRIKLIFFLCFCSVSEIIENDCLLSAIRRKQIFTKTKQKLKKTKETPSP